MTAIVGIRCKDGVVIGTDSSATFVHGGGHRTIEQPMEKICIIANNIIIAGTGAVGLDQRFCRIIEKAWKDNVFSQHHLDVGRELCKRAIDDFVYTRVQPGSYGALVAFQAGNKPHLCEFAVPDFQPEFKTERLWYVSMGSGQPITDPFLAFLREIFWQAGPPNLQEGIFAVTWTLELAIKINPGGVNGPLRIAVLEPLRGGRNVFEARMLEDKELDEHRENIDQAISCLRNFRADYKFPPESDIPDIPRP